MLLCLPACNLSGEKDGATVLLDLLLGDLGNKLSLDDNRLVLREHTFSQDLEVTMLSYIDQWSLLLLRGLILHLLRDQ